MDVREMMQINGKRVVSHYEAQQECLGRGYTLEMFNRCIQTYEELNIWSVDYVNNTITFI